MIVEGIVMDFVDDPPFIGSHLASNKWWIINKIN
jgi:hypothetical protein